MNKPLARHNLLRSTNSVGMERNETEMTAVTKLQKRNEKNHLERDLKKNKMSEIWLIRTTDV